MSPMMSRMALSSPPGVFICNTMTRRSRRAASDSPVNVFGGRGPDRPVDIQHHGDAGRVLRRRDRRRERQENCGNEA